MQLRSVPNLFQLEKEGVVRHTADSISERAKVILHEFCAHTSEISFEKVDADIGELLESVYEKSKLSHVLVHGDISDENMVRASKDDFVIIDWEHASIDVPL